MQRLQLMCSPGDVLKDFVDDSVTTMEDLDPELVMNPVLVARMQMERENKAKAGRKKGKARGNGLGNKTGGIARLGLNLVPEEKKKEEVPMQTQAGGRSSNRSMDVI